MRLEDLRRALRQAVGGRGPLDRRSYVTAGAILMAAKFLIDAAVIYSVTGIAWTPLDYVFPLVSLGASKSAAFSGVFSFLLLAWTLPFIWFGVTMSARRAEDAGIPIWLIVAFFLPLLNYVLLLALAIAPSRTRRATPRVVSPAEEPAERESRLLDSNGIAAVVTGTTAGLSAILIGVQLIRSYGLTVFLGVPFLIGFVTGYVASYRSIRSGLQTMQLVTFTVALTGTGLLLFELEGAGCLVMALPLAVPIAYIGGMMGRRMAERHEIQAGWTGMVMLAAVMPAGAMLDRGRVDADVRVVTTAIEVDAAPSRVWRHVIAFDEITAAPTWEFRFGLAYPLRARIDGTGPGAMRYCEFSTGAFVEPITAWDEPSRLAFDVIAQPPPLQEWSPYSRVYAPHLEGFFTTSHGEFRLIALPQGRTRLEGRTWYSLRMAPAIYWNPVADAILHRIHRRVLDHVKALAER